MIKVTRLNGKEFVVNCEQIEFIEQTPDTVISLVSGKKVVVQESVDEIIGKVIHYKRQIGMFPVEK
ncbi:MULTISPECIES: flagellar FlbD family protein [Carboxydocella]|uniref:Flagellar protein FlbD n=2 Tax=Carboxydocella TaxID=178898 RepID=A0A1T4PA94_9FIRM|nr:MULTISPECIES: flagellar FlbD family protein [Carboxydocella]AVX20765.1 flagellar protein FlbD [Carboxydocella thermautotrophica]AVX31184.1 flagellar protein FlbD [Carboxydocella thermautotrophica]SJZ88454.1 flagellar protein FlbD [Carboxydocella sporoproducens DSM 16521]GAW28294.1 flagellar protein [Carboxydocella sp. ULO1]GAW32135.1 flagellar protein [Carboxydocella sp. JDF658]